MYFDIKIRKIKIKYAICVITGKSVNKFYIDCIFVYLRVHASFYSEVHY